MQTNTEGSRVTVGPMKMGLERRRTQWCFQRHGCGEMMPVLPRQPSITGRNCRISCSCKINCTIHGRDICLPIRNIQSDLPYLSMARLVIVPNKSLTSARCCVSVSSEIVIILNCIFENESLSCTLHLQRNTVLNCKSY